MHKPIFESIVSVPNTTEDTSPVFEFPDIWAKGQTFTFGKCTLRNKNKEVYMAVLL